MAVQQQGLTPRELRNSILTAVAQQHGSKPLDSAHLSETAQRAKSVIQARTGRGVKHVLRGQDAITVALRPGKGGRDSDEVTITIGDVRGVREGRPTS